MCLMCVPIEKSREDKGVSRACVAVEPWRGVSVMSCDAHGLRSGPPRHDVVRGVLVFPLGGVGAESSGKFLLLPICWSSGV